MESLGRFIYMEEQRDLWRSGQLPREWSDAYPSLFDEDDLQLTRNQPDNHFFEWLAAIHIYRSTGWLSLVEKYQFSKHPRKQSIFFDLFDVEWREAIKGFGEQLPDLLVYRQDRSDFYFCEVKGRRDRLRNGQAEFFRFVERITGRSVFTVEYVEAKPKAHQ